jgi:hypothetical protein
MWLFLVDTVFTDSDFVPYQFFQKYFNVHIDSLIKPEMYIDVVKIRGFILGTFFSTWYTFSENGHVWLFIVAMVLLSMIGFATVCVFSKWTSRPVMYEKQLTNISFLLEVPSKLTQLGNAFDFERWPAGISLGTLNSPDLGFSWAPLVPPGKCRYNTLK